jgi:hypothetical protein
MLPFKAENKSSSGRDFKYAPQSAFNKGVIDFLKYWC